MSERRSVRGMPFVGMAAAGVVAGHWLAYVLAVPASAERARVLIASGHGYWSLAIKAAVVLAVLSLGTVLAQRLNTRLRGDEPVPERPSRLALRLAVGLGFVPLQRLLGQLDAVEGGQLGLDPGQRLAPFR